MACLDKLFFKKSQISIEIKSCLFLNLIWSTASHVNSQKESLCAELLMCLFHVCCANKYRPTLHLIFIYYTYCNLLTVVESNKQASQKLLKDLFLVFLLFFLLQLFLYVT